MSTMINVGPMIAKIARDLLEGGTSVLSVDSKDSRCKNRNKSRYVAVYMEVQK